jgi:hypothetical protein
MLALIRVNKIVLNELESFIALIVDERAGELPFLMPDEPRRGLASQVVRHIVKLYHVVQVMLNSQ